MMHNLCTLIDEFIEDKCIWVVKLSNGMTIYQDDDRPGVEPASAWIRLDNYINQIDNLHIKEMRLKFGTHTISLPSEYSHYFYSRGLIHVVGDKSDMHFHIVGWTNQDIIQCHWYKTPELVLLRQTVKRISKCRPNQLISRSP